MRVGLLPVGSGTVAKGVPAASGAPVAAGGAGSLRVAQFNLWNFFDTIDDPNTEDKIPSAQEYQVKLSKVARAISGELGSPDIISLNEIENERVLDDLLKLPEMQALGYQRVVGDLNDRRGIRVGMLYRSSRLNPVHVSQVNPKIDLPDPASGQFDPTVLFARAPLIVDFALQGAAQAAAGAGQLTVVANHFKSKLGGNGPEERRQAQGKFMGEWVDARRAAQPGVPIMVVGDLNATYQDGAYKKLAQRPDGSSRLTDIAMSIPETDRYTYIYRGRKDMLDHMLVTPEWKDALTGVHIPHFNTAKGAMNHVPDPTKAAGVSDHDPMVADFDLSKLFGASASARAGVAAVRR